MDMTIAEARHPERGAALDSSRPTVWWTVGLCILSCWLLFADLGSSALMEPDEGRNAEIGREILLLGDWVTPHYDFIPRLDKPMLFFDLVGISYRVFGISEWSARLPAVLAAMGCILLVFLFARRFFGQWSALWSALILLTSLEFFGFARLVMLETLLTFFVSLSLCCFFLGHQEIEHGKGRIAFLLMYAAMGAATATKGPIGFLLPGAVIFFYLLLAKRWALLRRMELSIGIPLFLLTVIPWYFFAESRNPGFLTYFLWEQNVVRFATTHFNRSQPWYFYILILSGGFFPWSVLLPSALGAFWKRSMTGERLFLVLWAAIPLIVFSLSASKLAHYILPIFPALAIIVGAMIGNAEKSPRAITRRLLIVPPVGFFLPVLAATLLIIWPTFLPAYVQIYINTTFRHLPAALLAGLAASLILILLAWRRQDEDVPVLLATAVSFVTITLLAHPIIETVGVHRSSKLLAEQAAAALRRQDHLVLFGTYPSGLPFYLRSRQPMAVVVSASKRTILGSDYVAMMRPQTAPGYGKVLYDYEEFGELWKTSKNRIVVFADKGTDYLVADLEGHPTRKLFQVGDIIAFENRPIADRELSDVGPRERSQ